MYEEQIQNPVGGLKAVAKISNVDAFETIEFTMFKQSTVLTTTEDIFISDNGNPNNDSFDRKTAYPTFELRGVVGDYPILYKSVDDNRRLHHVGGSSLLGHSLTLK